MIYDFYNGKATDIKGRTIEDILNLDDEELSSSRDYLPYIFPMLQENRSYPGAPILSKEELEKFRSDEAIKIKVKKSVNRFLAFLQSDCSWHNSIDKNHSKITAMIRFLSVIGMSEESNKICEWCINNGGGKNIHFAWSAAARNTSAPWENTSESENIVNQDE